MSFEHKEITEAIIGAAFEVHNVLGYGFLEKVYQKAMQVELIQRGHRCQTESQIKVHYKNVIVGDYRADLLVDEVFVFLRNRNALIIQTKNVLHAGWSVQGFAVVDSADAVPVPAPSRGP